MRKTIDEYLDGILTPPERSELERRLAADPALASLLLRMKQERALRAAALATYQPTPQEAAHAATNVLAAAEGPATLGYVGVWVKRIVGVAAVLALVAGSFVMGRSTAARQVAPAQAVVRVIYFDESGTEQIVDFNNLNDANAFVDRHHSAPQVAQNEVDLSRPGSL